MIIGYKTFLAKVEEIAAEEPAYRLGGYGRDGTCDCIGLIIGAIRRCGGNWPHTHGSNYAARNQTENLRKISSISDLEVGDLVYKAREPGDEKYDLPASYSSDPDKRDYCHVGVVLSVLPLRIRHMTSPKPKVDTSIGKWKYHGWCKKISRDGGAVLPAEGGTMGELVYISGGNPNAPINMRSGEGTDRKILKEIPQGSEAELLTYGEKWSKIIYKGTEGYVSSVFVRKQEVTSETIRVPKKELEKIYDTLGDWLGLRG